MEGERTEYITINVIDENAKESDTKSVSWSRNHTKLLLDFYSKYINQVGTMQIRNLKKMWQIISQDFKNMDIDLSPSNCENRWRVLERNFKKYVDNNNKTGRGRKDFEYAEEMYSIFGKKKNIEPVLLLNSQEVSYLDIEKKTIEKNSRQMENIAQVTSEKHGNKLKQPFKKRLRRDVLTDIRNDRKMYHDARLKLEQERIDRFETLEIKKLEERKRRNVLLEQRNTLLKEQNEIFRKKD